MKSKVTKIQFDKAWEHKKIGKFFDQWNVEFENGDKGQANTNQAAPPKPPWDVGDEAEYELKEGGDFPDKIKKVVPQVGFGGGGGSKWQPPTWETEKLKIPSMCTAYASQTVAALIAVGLIHNAKECADAVEALALAYAATSGKIAKAIGVSN